MESNPEMNKLFLLLLIIFSNTSHAQQPQQGKIIPEYGKTYKVESPGFETDTTSLMKVVFDVGRSFDQSAPNKLIQTAARYLNMHGQAGLKPENMKVALVLHGKAVQDVLKNQAYLERFPEAELNLNLPLIKALKEKGVRIILCGQSAAFYNIDRKNASEDVQFALSAMTALVQLQNDNYRLINF
ncbi:DsrE family protein [Christiangramia sabulilitoris]|uniref:DsrE family protein n=1 Tax=Christiangramia sabulilitoris TaxID=2583991 RepID=A0A550I330_9FLAO|nr:DsrE family protein [Christiangramia sabulilitoris]TRO65359.1 DsrE family protein [Christiangramia sabulilitoris]